MLNITEMDGNNLYAAEEEAANDAKELKSLGSGNTKYPTHYDPSVLERFPNPNPGADDLVGLDCFEFRSLCVSGDTMIDVCRDESRYPDGIPIKDLVGTEGYVFSFDTKTNSPVVRKYKDVRMTRKNAEVVKVIMKYRHNCTVGKPEYTTSEITCTPDHMFLVRKGFRDSEWVKAIDLKPDMRLIASQNGQDTAIVEVDVTAEAAEEALPDETAVPTVAVEDLEDRGLLEQIYWETTLCLRCPL